MIIKKLNLNTVKYIHSVSLIKSANNGKNLSKLWFFFFSRLEKSSSYHEKTSKILPASRILNLSPKSHQYQLASPLDYFLMFLPLSYLEEVLIATNRNFRRFRSNSKQLSRKNTAWHDLTSDNLVNTPPWWFIWESLNSQNINIIEKNLTGAAIV